MRTAAAGSTGNLSLTPDPAVASPALQLPHVVTDMKTANGRSSCAFDAFWHSMQVRWGGH